MTRYFIEAEWRLLHRRCQAIIWNNGRIFLIGPLGTNVSKILVEIHAFSLKKKAVENIVCKIGTILCRPQCVKTVRQLVWGRIFKKNIIRPQQQRKTTLCAQFMSCSVHLFFQNKQRDGDQLPIHNQIFNILVPTICIRMILWFRQINKPNSSYGTIVYSVRGGTECKC